MTDEWWTRLMYEDPTPARDIRACHIVKWHVSEVRHLATHGIRFEGQGPQTALDVVIEQHKSLHTADELKSHHVCTAVPDCTTLVATNTSRLVYTAHPHAAVGS